MVVPHYCTFPSCKCKKYNCPTHPDNGAPTQPGKEFMQNIFCKNVQSIGSCDNPKCGFSHIDPNLVVKRAKVKISISSVTPVNSERSSSCPSRSLNVNKTKNKTKSLGDQVTTNESQKNTQVKKKTKQKQTKNIIDTEKASSKKSVHQIKHENYLWKAADYFFKLKKRFPKIVVTNEGSFCRISSPNLKNINAIKEEILKVEHMIIASREKHKVFIEESKKLYPTVFFSVIPGSPNFAICIHSGLNLNLSEIGSDIGERKFFTKAVTISDFQRKELKNQMKNRVDYPEIFGLNDDITCSVKNNNIIVSGFVKKGISKSTLRNVNFWLENNSCSTKYILIEDSKKFFWWKRIGLDLIKKKFPSPQISTCKNNNGKNCIKIVGTKSVIRKIQGEVATIAETVHCEIVFNCEQSSYAKRKISLLKEGLEPLIKRTKIVCYHNNQVEILSIIGIKDQKFTEIIESIEDMDFSETEYSVKTDVIKQFKKDEYALTKNLEKNLSVHINVSPTTITVTGFKESRNCLYLYLQDSTTVTDFITPSSNELSQITKKDKKYIEKFFQSLNIAVKSRILPYNNTVKYEILGLRDNVDKAKLELGNHFQDLESKKCYKCLNFPNHIIKIINQNIDAAYKIANETGVWIEIGDNDNVSKTSNANMSNHTSSKMLGYKYKAKAFTKQISIEVLEGDITQQPVEVIVNAANQNLFNSGGVAKAIAHAADINDECSKWISKNGIVKIGDVAVTSGGKLTDVKHIFHAVGPHWDKCGSKNELMLSKVFSEIFKQCEIYKVKSIAIPLISSGIFNQGNADAVIFQVIAQSIHKFIASFKSKPTCLELIRIVEIDSNKCKAFIGTLEQKLGPGSKSLSSSIITAPVTKIIEPKYIFYWFNDHKMVPYGDHPTDPMHIQLSNALDDGKTELGPLTIDSDKYKSGANYIVNFIDKCQINLDTKFKREINWELNPNYKQVVKKQKKKPLLKPVKEQGKVILSSIFQENLDDFEKGLGDLIETGKSIIECYDVFLSPVDIKQLKSTYEIDITCDGTTTTLEGETEAVKNVELHIYKRNYRNQKNDYPTEWTDDLKFKLDANCEEYVTVEKRIKETIPAVKIISIERIQCKSLYTSYQANIKALRIRDKAEPAVKELFHGTGHTDPDSILSHDSGFDRSFSNSGMWGKGTYFATNASYSNGYAFTDDNGNRKFFIAEVIIGNNFYELSSPKTCAYVTAPTIPGTTRRYDSVSGPTGGNDVYITYTDCRQYPKYLITYSE